MCLIAGIIGGSIPSRISVTLTGSLDHRLFVLGFKPEPDDIEKGRFVLFQMSHPRIEGGKPVNAIKRVSCVAGERLAVKGKNVYCQGKLLATAKEMSLEGEPLERFEYDGEIPEGKIFVTGTSKDSLDSRYFGFINASEVKAIAYPII